jgi:hypothetical protein
VWQGAVRGAYPVDVSLVAIVLLLAAIVLVVATEWSRITKRSGVGGSLPRRRPRRRKSHLHVVQPYDESDEFARSVERDLANLPTIDERDRKG